MVKNLSAMQEAHVPSLVLEDPLEKEMATHSNILAWRIPWTEDPGGLQSVVFTGFVAKTTIYPDSSLTSSEQSLRAVLSSQKTH